MHVVVGLVVSRRGNLVSLDIVRVHSLVHDVELEIIFFPIEPVLRGSVEMEL